MTVLSGARVVTPEGVLEPGWVELAGDRIAAVGAGRRDGEAVAGWLLPGFLDLHVHGGGGYDFAAGRAAIEGGVAFHRAHGTTGSLVSLVSAPPELLCEQLGRVADLAESGLVLGAHLEGPFLAPRRCGAHDPDHLLDPDPEVLAALLKAGRGHVRVMTVAPELPGALDLVDALVAEGVVAAIGHTDATYEQALAAFARGAALVTHAFNTMRTPHHREPGPIPAALDAGVPCELINDGVHVHPAAARLLTGGPLVLVTDAIDAAGAGDGAYRLGGRDVVVRDGRVRLADGGALAGSTLTMDEAVRRAVTDVGLSVAAASAAASATPAAVLGVADRCGRIAPGLAADLVLLDDDLRVRRVMARGSWL
ncbi:N-acetylglucosamine-6-phosphate deacetylase [Pilimelia anulata]|uniref:N-acetylglucosamine-6-phosphate deacetylase n=1 Tax=Pilimelia anulata TaxID=53371 RepID=A0A8J3F9W6_9ACTN|nr:N-acetylglucosamine-6-phosphate deacetylase [Pilimelia anulata]GGJ94694.1 N-acetylglucosamine-6-phosphate deacetylase [Pilimelia anulata]